MLLILALTVPGYYIKLNTILLISYCILQRLIIKRLKGGLNTNIQTNLTKDTSSEVN